MFLIVRESKNMYISAINRSVQILVKYVSFGRFVYIGLYIARTSIKPRVIEICSIFNSLFGSYNMIKIPAISVSSLFVIIILSIKYLLLIHACSISYFCGSDGLSWSKNGVHVNTSTKQMTIIKFVF